MYYLFYFLCFFLSYLLPAALFLFSFPCEIPQSPRTFCFLILSPLIPRFNIELPIQLSGHSFIYSVSQFFIKYMVSMGGGMLVYNFYLMLFVCFYKVKAQLFYDVVGIQQIPLQNHFLPWEAYQKMTITKARIQEKFSGIGEIKE